MDVIAIPREVERQRHVLQNLEAGKVHLTVEEYARLDAAFPAPRKSGHDAAYQRGYFGMGYAGAGCR